MEKSQILIKRFTSKEMQKLKSALNTNKSIKSILDQKFTKDEFDQFIEVLFSKDFRFNCIFTNEELENLKLAVLKEYIAFTFDGKLKKEELEILKENLFTKRQIKKIESYLEKYKDSLTGFKDLVGDTLIPDKKSFFIFMNWFGYYLKNNPDEVLSERGIKIRRALNPKLKELGKSFLGHEQIIENREFLKASKEDRENKIFLADKEIILPNEPVIWAISHEFKADGLASILACPRHAYIVFGNTAQLYNTIDGLFSYLNGVLVVNRKVNASRTALIPKAVKALNYGVDLHWYPEAIWDKSPNLLSLEAWSGFWRAAKETGCMVVPMVHYVKDATNPNCPIHTVIDDPIKIDDLSEKAALDLWRDIVNTWKGLMIEAYGNSTYKESLNGFETSHEAWEDYLKRSTGLVDRYDSEAERNADFRSKERENLRFENVFEPIANSNSPFKDEAKTLVRIKKMDDYQRRI